MRPIQEVKVTPEPPPFGGEKHTHPAFAQISAHRISGQSRLYGSDFNHMNAIRITINASEFHRGLSSDSYFAKREYIEVELSEVQWASFVSSLNAGCGTPCTLRSLHNEQIPTFPKPESKKDVFKKEVAEMCEEALGQIRDLKSKIDGMTLSKKAKDELLSSVSGIGASMQNSIPYILGRFGEHMETTVEKAKGEINAYATQAVMRAGLESLKGESPKIIALNGE